MNYKKYIIVSFFVVLIGCAPENPILVTVNNNNYTVADFEEFYQFTPADDSLTRMERINEFVNQVSVINEARARGYEEDLIVKAAFETHRKDIISRGFYEAEVLDKIKISEADIRKIYNKIVEQYHLAQIIVAEDSLAQYLENELKRGVSFDSLLQFSLDTLSINGDIGTFSAISLPPEILESLKKTKVDGVTDAIKLGNSIYFLKVLEYKIADTPKYEDVRVSIESNLMREQAMKKGTEFTQQIIDKATIEYNQEGLDILMKPDSLITEADLNTWVVKKYDTSYVYVKTIKDAIQYQYQRSFIAPQQLIDRVLTPDLVYDEAIRKNFDKKSETKRKLQNSLSLLLYQKLYSDEILENAIIDSIEVVKYYKEHWIEYKDKKFSEIYGLLKSQLREERVEFLRNNLFGDLRKKYKPEINEETVAKLLKEEM